MCYSLWCNAPTMLPAGSLEAEFCHTGLLTACEQEHLLLLTSCQKTCTTTPLAGYGPATSWVRYCCIVMPAGTVLLFCRYHFIDVYCHMLLQLYSLCYTGHGKIAKNSVRPRWVRKQSGPCYIVKHVLQRAIAGHVS